MGKNEQAIFVQSIDVLGNESKTNLQTWPEPTAYLACCDRRVLRITDLGRATNNGNCLFQTPFLQGWFVRMRQKVGWKNRAALQPLMRRFVNFPPSSITSKNSNIGKFASLAWGVFRGTLNLTFHSLVSVKLNPFQLFTGEEFNTE